MDDGRAVELWGCEAYFESDGIPAAENALHAITGRSHSAFRLTGDVGNKAAGSATPRRAFTDAEPRVMIA
ncbi:hypothetical protein KACC15558_05930 [Brevibacterium ammoniilyticum]|uniref:Uncharacterized protein n=1 Tax=Brevibacterium ammoniilyticum TaxID=1046555 RepID=A0ABP9TWQ4_9MICO